MKWQDVNKKLVALFGAGGIGVIGLFSYLFLLAGTEYTYSGDSVCDGLECSAYINVTESYWSVCFEHTSPGQNVYFSNEEFFGNTNLNKITYSEIPVEIQPAIYKKSTRGRTLWVNIYKIDQVMKTDPELPVEWYVATTKKYANHSDKFGYWREIKDGDCWDRTGINKNKFIVRAEEGARIKWNFNVGEIEIDPILVSWEYFYDQVPYEDPVYIKKNITVKDCNTEKNCTEYMAKNMSITENCTYYQVCKDIIKETEEFSYYETKYKNGEERKGINIGGEEIEGYINIQDNKLIEWSVPIGDRNFEEYGNCRKYKMEKGLCKETEMNEVARIEK